MIAVINLEMRVTATEACCLDPPLRDLWLSSPMWGCLIASHGWLLQGLPQLDSGDTVSWASGHLLSQAG